MLVTQEWGEWRNKVCVAHTRNRVHWIWCCKAFRESFTCLKCRLHRHSFSSSLPFFSYSCTYLLQVGKVSLACFTFMCGSSMIWGHFWLKPHPNKKVHKFWNMSTLGWACIDDNDILFDIPTPVPLLFNAFNWKENVMVY